MINVDFYHYQVWGCIAALTILSITMTGEWSHNDVMASERSRRGDTTLREGLEGTRSVVFRHECL
jgi:hypothetical protein